MMGLAARSVLGMTPNKLMLGGSLRIAWVLLYYNEGQSSGAFCDWKEIAKYIDLHPARSHLVDAKLL